MWGSSEPTFTEGAQLYVVAPSGLTIRHMADADSEALDIVPFGSSVIVLAQPDKIPLNQKINWVDGQWIYVEYAGITGYMFDGYLTDLPLPIYEFEKCQMDMDFIYPLESWSDINLGLDRSDTISAGALYQVTNHYEAGDILIKRQVGMKYAIELTLNDVRLMDAYHLLISMMEDSRSISVFKELTTFIEDANGDLSTIKIDVDYPMKINKNKNGSITILAATNNPVCGR